MRYYYTCPIKAAYMSRMFGVKFLLRGYNVGTDEWEEKEMNLKDLLDEDLISICEVYPDQNRIYVAPESEEIMKPKSSDAGVDLGGHFYDRFGESWYPENKNLIIAPEETIKIIMRENKHFFQAEVESE